MNLFIVVISATIAIIGLIVFFILRGSRRKETAQATVATPSAGTEQRVDQDFVEITFTTKTGEVVSFDYYYDKKIFQYPQDFQRDHPVVTVKYELGNPDNYIVFETRKGDYSTLIGATVIGTCFGAFIAANQEGAGFIAKAKVFTIWFLVTAGISFLIIRFNAYFSFLNIFTKRDEE